MATVYFGKDSVGGYWSDTAKWWADAARTIPYGSGPTNTDTAVLDAQSGMCEIIANAGAYDVDASAYVSWLVVYSGCFLRFRRNCYLTGAGAHFIFQSNTYLDYSAGTANGILATQANQVIPELHLFAGNASTLTINSTCTLTHVIWQNRSPAKTVNLTAAASTDVFIDGYSITGSGTGVPSVNGLGTLWWRIDFDTRDFNAISGTHGFGYNADVTITLRADLVSTYGTFWYLDNSDSADHEIDIITPGSPGSLRVASQIIARTTGAGNLKIDFSGAQLQKAAAWADYTGLFTTARTNPSSKLVIDWGSNNEFGIQNGLDLRYVTNMSGGGSGLNTIFLQGATTDYYKGPITYSGVDPDGDELPCSLDMRPHSAYACSFSIDYGINIGGDVYIATAAANVHLNVGTNSPGYRDDVEIGGDFYFDAAGTDSYVAFARDTFFGDDYTVEAADTYWDGIKADLSGDIIFGNNSILYQDDDSETVVHVQQNEDKYIYFSNSAAPDGSWSIIQDNVADGGGSYAVKFNHTGAQKIIFDSLTITNEVDAKMIVQLNVPDGTTEWWCFNELTITGRGDVCATPISDEYMVHLQVAGTTDPVLISTNLASAHTAELTKFIKVNNTGTHWGADSTIIANDGTCIDGGSNSGITFTQTTGSIAICPDDEASFIACYYGTLPEQQQFIIKNIGIGLLPEPTVTNKPAWLSVNFSKEGTGWLMNIWPNDTTIAAGVHNETITINVAGARRSPHDFAIEYELTYCIIPYPTPSPKTFTIIHKTTYPGPATISVDNPSAGHTAVMDTPISLLNMPDWLDADINPLGETGDHQAVEFTVNATGLALPTGIYHAYIEITADNADENGVLHIILDVSEILVDTEPAAMTFTIREGGSLPDPQALNISNSGVATLTGVTVVDDAAWLTSTLIGSGDGNNQYATIELNAAAQALAGGTYYATITVDSAVANNTPYTVPVTLVVVPPVLFLLNPESIEFTPDKDWNIPAAQTVQVIGNNQGPFAAPVAVTGAPAWLSVTINAINPLLQIITLTPLEIPVDPLDFSATLTITGSYSAELPVSMTLPAFFRRADCQMDFIPRIIGTIIDECDVPPPPPLAPVSAPIIPTLPAPTYPNNITMVGPPCIDCVAWVEYDQQDEYGFGKAHFYIVCDDHGCLEVERELLKGVYSEFNHVPGGAVGGNDNHVITAIEIDECGHVCGIWFEDDDMSSSE
jgi:hypothetical protein